MLELTTQQWVLGITGALLVGIGKGGLPGIANITVWLYAIAFGAKESVGILLPVLICGDIVAVTVYKRHADFRHVWRLMPWSMFGVVIGFLLFDIIPAQGFAKVIGALLLVMTALHFFRQWLLNKHQSGREDLVPHKLWFIGTTGTLGGVATMLANAAGPIAAFYLMAVKLPKLAFIGTAAWFFFLINVFKLPFQAAAGNLHVTSLFVSVAFGGFAVLGGLIAPRIVKTIPQKYYEVFIWTLIVIAGISMLW